jgi:hypothetical protein
MAGRRLLLPQNFSPNDRKAVDFVVDTFGQQKDVSVTLFHTYTPMPPVEVSHSTVTDKLRSNMSFLQQQINEKQAGMEAIRAELVEKGFDESSIQLAFKPRKKDIAGELVDLYGETHFELLVLSRKPGKVSRFFTGSVHQKVMATLKDTTICVVS